MENGTTRSLNQVRRIGSHTATDNGAVTQDAIQVAPDPVFPGYSQNWMFVPELLWGRAQPPSRISDRTANAVASFSAHVATAAARPKVTATIQVAPSTSTAISPAVQPSTHVTPDATAAPAKTDNTTQVALGANVATGLYGVTGAGIKIGIISDSFNNTGGAASDVRAGSLPSNVTILGDQAGGGTDEGRAMTELAYSVASGSQYYFANSGGDFASFSAAVAALQAAGCKIIVDDVSIATEEWYQTGSLLDKTITTAVSAGVDYFTAAGNNGRDFFETGFKALNTTIAGLGAVTAADIGGNSPYLSVTIAAGETVNPVLAWAQPSGSYGSASAQNSFAVYILDSSGAIVASSVTSHVGGNAQHSFFFTNTTTSTAFRVVVVQNGGVVPAGQLFKFIFYNNVGTINNANAGVGSGTLQGHEFLPGVNSVAGVNVTTAPASGGTPAIEPFSSSGPGDILYGANGVPLAIVPNEPQFAGVDGTNTNTANTGTDFSPFFGTSAAAPSAAAVSALILQANSTLSTTQITSILVQSTIPAAGPGDNGAGLIQARAAVEIGAADKGARWTSSAGGNWTAASSWSTGAAPTTAVAASLDDNLGGFTGHYTVTVNTGGNVAGSLAIATPFGSSATLLITTGGSLAVGGSAAANITAGDLLVSDNGTLKMTGGKLSVAGSLNVNNGTVVFTTGTATAANYAQDAGSFTLGGGSAAFLSLTGTGYGGAAAFAETGGTVTVAAGGTLISGGVAGSASTFTNAFGGLVDDTGTATFTNGTVVDGGIFTATTTTVSQSTFTDSGDWTDSAALNFIDSAATVSLGGILTVAALTVGNALLAFTSTLLDAGNILDTGNLGIGTANTGGTISVAAGGSLSIGGTADFNNTIDFTGNGLLTFTSTTADTLANKLQATIGGFAKNVGRIDFTKFAYNAADTTSYNASSGDLAVFDQNGKIAANVFLDTTASYAAGFRLQSNGAANKLEVVVACFAEGTRILTKTGEVAVEDLSVGDIAVIHAHSDQKSGRIVWIGQRRVDIARHPNPELVRPIRFAPGSLGAGVPKRPMLLSPDHALFIDGALIQARQLVNGVSITVQDVPVVCYFHVELERHAILLADGAPAESYLDTGDRAQFYSDGVTALRPDFARDEHPSACAPLLTEAAVVQPIWKRLAERAGLTTFEPAITREARLTLVLADGSEVSAHRIDADGRHLFMTAGSEIAWLSSRHAAPSDIRPWLDDRRQLGVCIGAMAASTCAGFAQPVLGHGWWAAEIVDGQERRWTDGNAAIALPTGCHSLSVTVMGTAEYPQSRNRMRAA